MLYRKTIFSTMLVFFIIIISFKLMLNAVQIYFLTLSIFFGIDAYADSVNLLRSSALAQLIICFFSLGVSDFTTAAPTKKIFANYLYAF